MTSGLTSSAARYVLEEINAYDDLNARAPFVIKHSFGALLSSTTQCYVCYVNGVNVRLGAWNV